MQATTQPPPSHEVKRLLSSELPKVRTGSALHLKAINRHSKFTWKSSNDPHPHHTDHQAAVNKKAPQGSLVIEKHRPRLVITTRQLSFRSASLSIVIRSTSHASQFLILPLCCRRRTDQPVSPQRNRNHKRLSLEDRDHTSQRVRIRI